MPLPQVVAIISLLISILGVVLGIGAMLWKLQFKVNVLWKVFVDQPPTAPRRGRRQTDRSLLGLIEDRGFTTKADHD